MAEQELMSARWYEEAMKQRESETRRKPPMTFGEKLNLVVALTLLPVASMLAYQWYQVNSEWVLRAASQQDRQTAQENAAVTTLPSATDAASAETTAADIAPPNTVDAP
ncbi:MAG: hypothetical protein R3C19_10190 [Planctomycetaceae bacterium]